MKPKNEELLYYLLWSAEGLLRPTWRNIDQSFETWALHRGLARRLAELSRQRLIERHPDGSLERVVRLTEKGRELALGGREPMQQWSRAWDGRWRLVLFDLPSGHHDLRQGLLRLLRRRHFGFLQNSVWISPDATNDVRAILGKFRVQADAFLVIEGKPAAGETDAEIVQAAWEFERINRHYEQYLALAERPPADSRRIAEWARRENAAWRAALQHDPLLPAALLPQNYLGREAYQRRAKVFTHLLQFTADRENAGH